MATLRRLFLGVFVIAAASALLLLSDTSGSRREAGGVSRGKRWKLDLLEFITVIDVEEAERGIRTGLPEAGLVEGRDYELTVRSAHGDMPTLSALVDAAMGDGADIILTLSTPTLQAALQRARGVPIVFTFCADPVAAGAGKSAEDHLPNVTGVASASAYEDVLALIRECMPSARRLGTLFVPAEVNSVYSRDRIADAAPKYGFELVSLASNTTSEVPDATLALLSQHIDAVCQVGANQTTAAFASIALPAQRAKMPVFGFLTSDFDQGATAVIASDYFDAGQQVARLAARIMHGESPAGMPFQPIRKRRTLVNLALARAAGLTIPPAVVARADVVTGR